MKLILVRHAIAAPREQSSDTPDEQRALTPEGIRKMKRNVDGLAQMKLSIEQIWSSPLVRAVQTAELLRGGLNLTERIREIPALKPDGDMDILLNEIHEARNVSALALVGHEPYLSELMCRLLSMDGRCTIEFKKGGASCFEVDSQDSSMRCTLEWLLTPKQLRQIGKKCD